jgi:hypothetical protein
MLDLLLTSEIIAYPCYRIHLDLLKILAYYYFTFSQIGFHSPWSIETFLLPTFFVLVVVSFLCAFQLILLANRQILLIYNIITTVLSPLFLL